MTDHIPDATKMVGRPQIREVFLRNGAVIPADRDDLPDYVYESVFELMELAAPDVQGEPVAHTFYVLHDSTEGQKYIKKDIDDGCLAIFEMEEDAQRAKRRHSGTDYKRVDYYTAPQPRSDALIVEQTERIAATLAKAFFGSELPPGALFRDSENLKAQACWRVAADIQEELTGTDVENALAELEDEQQPAVQGEPSPQPPGFIVEPDDSDEGASLWDHGYKRGWNACLEATTKAMQPAEQQPCPEDIREGAPYDDPAFESLCREHGIWGTAAAAQCAVFWGAGKRVAEQKPAPDVAGLVEALGSLMESESRGRVMPVGESWDQARAALAAYRKGGDQP